MMKNFKAVRGKLLRIPAFLCLLALAVSPAGLRAQTPLDSSFTYQGLLVVSSVPANGLFDFEFRLFDALAAGGQIGSLNTVGDLSVVDGAFTATLDFGATAFAGDKRWLEIRVRPGASTGAYTLLTPRQELTPAPNALHSVSTGALRGRPVSVTAPGTGEVLKWNGTEWAPAADLFTASGAPAISSVSDVTGGLLVIGDRIDITGSSLGSVDAAFVGGERAPIISQSAGAMQIQIPDGIPNGVNEVKICDVTGDVGLSASASVNVHRLAVFLGASNSRITIVDTLTHTPVVALAQTIFSEVPDFPYHIAFANNGSLALVPAGQGTLTFIDLTANPITLSSLSIGGTRIGAVCVAPDGLFGMASDIQGNRLRPFTITDFFPPYTTPLTTGTSLFLGASEFPRSGVFINNRWVAVALAGQNEIGIFERSGAALLDDDIIRVDTGGILTPARLRMIEPLSTIFAIGQTDVLRMYRAAEETMDFTASFTPGGVVPTGAADFDLSPGGAFAYVVDDVREGITPVRIGPTSLQLFGDDFTDIGEPDRPGGTALNTIAVEPVEGDYFYLGMDNGANSVDIFDITKGASFTRRTGPANPLLGNTNLSNCRGIGIQP